MFSKPNLPSMIPAAKGLGLAVLGTLALVACGGGGGGSGGGGGASAAAAPATYAIGGKVSGLSASGLVLQDNGGDNLTVSSGSTSFTFPTKLAGGAAYAVTILTQPSGETCSLSGATGNVSGADVSNVSVSCVTTPPA